MSVRQVPGASGNPGDGRPEAGPALSSPLRWTTEGHLLGEVAGATVRFTGRQGGVSTGAFSSLNLGSWTDDVQTHVTENRRRLAGWAGVDPARLAQAHQVHGSDVLVIADDADLPGAGLEAIRAADGTATAQPETPCVVLCADCLPVALVTDGAVAMVHAGWRGLVGGVLENGVRALQEAAGRADRPVTAVVGPGAGSCCYEVGDEVHGALASLGPAVRAGNHADLSTAARLRLERAGVARVIEARHCTICDPRRFFSHRRDAGRTGRQAGAVWLT